MVTMTVSRPTLSPGKSRVGPLHIARIPLPTKFTLACFFPTLSHVANLQHTLPNCTVLTTYAVGMSSSWGLGTTKLRAKR